METQAPPICSLCPTFSVLHRNRIISRTTGVECFRSYYKHNTISLLLSCLNQPNIAEGAAETLVSGFVRDINGHMTHFEQDPQALHLVMDVMYRSAPAVQTHLTNLFAFAIKWPRATDFIRKALGNGLLSLMSYMLQSEALSTQEAAIGAITALLQKVSIVADLSDYATQLIDNILLSNLIDTVTRITTHVDFRIDSKAMFHVVTMYELLSIHTVTHTVLYTPLDQNKTNLPRGTGNPQVSAYSQALKLLNLLSEKTENMDIYAKTISSILTFCFYIISVAPRKDMFIENSTLLKSCCRVLCKSKLATLKADTVNIFYLYATRSTAIASMLMQARSYTPFAEALIQCMAEDIMSKNNTEGSDIEDEVNLNCSLDLLAFVLAQFHILLSSCAPQGSLHINTHNVHINNSDDDNVTYCTMASDSPTDVDMHASLRELFLRIANHTTLWPYVVLYLRSRNRQKVVFAARIVHVLACYKDVRVMTRLHEQVSTHNIIDCITESVARAENNKVESANSTGAVNVLDIVASEMLFLALGSIVGSSACFPWEVDCLSLAPLHATTSTLSPLSAMSNSPMNGAGSTGNRNAPFSAPHSATFGANKSSLPLSPYNPGGNPGNLHMQAIYQEERAILLAQRRANLECGSSVSELACDSTTTSATTAGASNAVPTSASVAAEIAAVLKLERRLRAECAHKLAPFLQTIIENDELSNVGASVAALRFLQIVLQDSIAVDNQHSATNNGRHSGALTVRSAHNADVMSSLEVVKELSAQIHYYCFVTLLPEMNKVQVITALDVLGLMTLNADFSVDEAVQIVTDLLHAQDSMVRCKALDTLVYFSLNPTCLASIDAFSLGPLSHLLRYSQHLQDPTLDSHYIICSVLTILTRLVVDEGVCNVILKSALFTGLIEILKLDDSVLDTQALYEGYGRSVVVAVDDSSGSGTSSNGSGAGVYATPVLTPRTCDATHITMRTIRHYIFQCIHAFVSYHSCRSILLAANIPHYLLQQIALFGVSDRHNGVIETPHMLTKGSITETPDEDCQSALNSLFLLAFKAHRSLKDSVLSIPDACHSLVKIWAGGNAQLSYKASVVLMRCGISGEPAKNTDFTSKITTESAQIELAYKQLTVPWTMLIDTLQIFLLFDLIDDTNTTAASGNQEGVIVTFDEFTDNQVKIVACEALHIIIRRANANPNDHQLVQETIQELCKSDLLIPRLEHMCRVTPTAAVLINDIRSLSNLSFQDNAEELCAVLNKQLRSRSAIQRNQAVALLAGYLRKHPTDTDELCRTLPLPHIARALNDGTRHCLIKALQRARSTFMSDLPEVIELIMSIITVQNTLAVRLAGVKAAGADEGDDEISLTSSTSNTDARDDAGVQKTLGYAPDSKDYILKSLLDALTVLSGHENSAAALVGNRQVVGVLLQTLRLQVDSVLGRRAKLQRAQLSNARAAAASPSPFLESEEIDLFELELVLTNSVLDVLLNLVQTAEEVVSEQLQVPSAAATGDDETGLEMLLSTAVDANAAPVLSYRPDAPRNVKFTLKNFLVRPIEPSLGEQLFFLLSQVSCSSLSTAAAFIAHPTFLSELSSHFRDDIDNWLSLVPHLQECKEADIAAAVAAGAPQDSPPLSLRCLSGDDDDQSVMSRSLPSRTLDKPTQSMEAYVADILSAKLALMTNLSRVATGRDRIYAMQKELQSLLQLIIMYVELPDVKLIYAILMLLTALAPMIYQPLMKDKQVNAFVLGCVTACLNAAARAEDLTVIEKVWPCSTCTASLLHSMCILLQFALVGGDRKQCNHHLVVHKCVPASNFDLFSLSVSFSCRRCLWRCY